MSGFYEVCGEELFNVHPDPVILELNNLQNQLKEKDRELGVALSEIKALKATEVLKDKALEELGNEFQRLEEKLKIGENVLEQKNLDMKRLVNEKKEALAAQYAAEATLRRVYADQKDDDAPPLESIIAPLEAEIKMYKNEIAALQEDTRSLERHTRSKEVALLEAERILKSSLERALIVEEIQNQNFELRRQIEIFQEENKILDKTNRQKILEVEKLSETIIELEEAILAGGAAANTLRDYKRRISELQEEKRTLERELSRVKVSANRVATVVANEWKNENDKVMPVKQWLEERRLLQAEMQRLRDKLSISERTAKAEAQLKDKLKLRLKTLEEGLRHVFNPNGSTKPQKTKHYLGNSLVKKSLWTSRNKNVGSIGKENEEMKENSIVDRNSNEITDAHKMKNQGGDQDENKTNGCSQSDNDDIVSGFLYDKLQKEVICLRKFCETKESALNTKDEEIKTLTKKIETLSKAIEVEARKRKVKQQGS
ncbi:microtubule-associated protein 70-5-like [Solanum dulcamara]|uniref:microtubule-associated protein 70-5-like n=1 Tax=Solanum dulcamara TaxID=45834 RepID=UPI002486B66E|nr:microtubule-associated protein 70-5-like [Solanum dulcamara]